jgi:dipeptidyl aminopeptidase/acylaminoacyl peptidase
MPQTAPYGTWVSPITADLIVAKGVDLGQVSIHGEDIFWVEGRAQESGRSVVVRRTPDGKIWDVTPQPWNARTRVHEYGGVSYLVADDAVFFTNFADQHIYHIPLADGSAGAEPVRITAQDGMRYADLVWDAARRRLLCVREDHTQAGREPVNTIVAVPIPEAGSGVVPAAGVTGRAAGAANDGGAEAAPSADVQVLAAGNDFYASLALSPDGRQLAYLTWNHPNMPWDGTELWLADIAPDGRLEHARCVAGGPQESIFQPAWSPDGVLHFVSDRSGWWNLYRLGPNGPEPLYPMEAEFGVPQWVFGQQTYGFVSESEIACLYTKDGQWQLALLDVRTRALKTLGLPFTHLYSLHVRGTVAVCVAASPSHPASVVLIDLRSGTWEVLRKSVEVDVDPGYLSTPEPIAFPSADGRTAYGFYYAPKNKDFAAPSGEKPPLLVMSHGGPTSAASSAFNLGIQFWTSRGIAVLDVNYGGSTGYGRAYRDALKGQWGIVDVQDCAAGARYLVDRGDVDGERLAIRGGSAGGYTTLASLVFTDTFRAGASYFGVSDLELLARDTHKFESRYLDSLIGPYPERRDLYIERSPIHHTEKLKCPVIFFQGLDDRVVPPNQAEEMVAQMRARGIPVAYVAYEGEGHGFRRAENIKHSLEAELSFYGEVFGFTPAGPLARVPLDSGRDAP